MKKQPQHYEGLSGVKLRKLLEDRGLPWHDISNQLTVMQMVTEITPGQMAARNEAVKRLRQEDERLAYRKSWRLSKWNFVGVVIGILLGTAALIVGILALRKP